MDTFKSPHELQNLCVSLRGEGKTIALVPTMGALHEGHLSLVRAARDEVDVVVASIYINPLQFGPDEDLNSYPRDFDSDKDKLQNAGVDILFFPSDTTMYPDGYSTYVGEIELSQRWCGKSRPGHFRGVTTVVLKLFNIVQPHIAVFGEKDYQQVTIIRKMIADLNLQVAVKACPVVRELDGLAMSSRNQYLTMEQREDALTFKRALDFAHNEFNKGVRQGSYLTEGMKLFVQANPNVQLDFAACVDRHTLKQKEHIEEGDRLLIAGYVGSTRLIDTMALKLVAVKQSH